MKLKTYRVYLAGSTHFCDIRSTCISKATKEFMKTLDRPASYKLSDRYGSTVRYLDNYTIMSDFVINEAN